MEASRRKRQFACTKDNELLVRYEGTTLWQHAINEGITIHDLTKKEIDALAEPSRLTGVIQYFEGTIAFSSTGVKNILAPFLIERVKLEICQKYGVTDTTNHESVGEIDALGDMHFRSTYSKSSTHRSFSDTNKGASFYTDVSGTPTEKIAIDNAGCTWTATNLQLNVIKADVAYNIYLIGTKS